LNSRVVKVASSSAHRLQHRWRTINPGQLDDLAADLWQDEQLRKLEPANAVDKWLAPIWAADPARSH
jgi:hypothetical protein